MKPASKTYTLRLETKLLETVHKVAAACGVTTNKFIGEMLTYYLTDSSRIDFIDIKIQNLNDKIKLLEDLRKANENCTKRKSK